MYIAPPLDVAVLFMNLELVIVAVVISKYKLPPFAPLDPSSFNTWLFMKLVLFMFKLTWEVYIAPPSKVAAFCVKLEFSIVKLPSSWSITPPNSEADLVNVEFMIFTVAIESINKLPPILAEIIFSNSE